MTRELLERERTVEVKVVVMGRRATYYTGPAPLVLGEVLDAVGVAPQMESRVNGLALPRDHQLAPGDQIVVVPKIRGGC